MNKLEFSKNEAQPKYLVNEMNIYQEFGFNDRKEYLSDLAEQYNLSMYEVSAISEMLSEREDFDGLVTTLEDYILIFA